MSLPCMKKMSMMIDCKNDVALVDDDKKKVKLHRFNHGGQHYWLSITKEDDLNERYAV